MVQIYKSFIYGIFYKNFFHITINSLDWNLFINLSEYTIIPMNVFIEYLLSTNLNICSIFTVKLLCCTRLFFSIYSIISALLLNETRLGSLSKVVQQVQNYLYLNFQQVWINIREVIGIFVTVLIKFCSLNSERNFPILFKVKWLWKIRQSCSASSKLLISQFL